MGERLVAIEADLGEQSEQRWRYGSGLRVGGRMVLTAAHVVRGAVEVTVKVSGPGHEPLVAVVDPSFIGDPGELDLALLDVPGLTEPFPDLTVAVVDRNTPTGQFVEGCWSVGYPAFTEVKRDEHAAWTRESKQVGGRIAPLSGREEGLFSLEVTARPDNPNDPPLPPQGIRLRDSPWSGMSGAAVFADEALVGVVAEHAVRRGPSDITITPLDFLEAHAPPNAAQWWERLGVSEPSRLARLPEAVRRGEPVYRATLQAMRARTEKLLGRERELAQIAAFATGASDAFGTGVGSEDYVWLVGGAWAGKTALLAEAVGSLGDEDDVDVVAYFRRYCCFRGWR